MSFKAFPFFIVSRPISEEELPLCESTEPYCARGESQVPNLSQRFFRNSEGKGLMTVPFPLFPNVLTILKKLIIFQSRAWIFLHSLWYIMRKLCEQLFGSFYAKNPYISSLWSPLFLFVTEELCFSLQCRIYIHTNVFGNEFFCTI